MSTTTTAAPRRQRQPRPKPERRIRLCVKPVDQSPGVVRIRVGAEEADYLLTELAADFGRGFKVEKMAAENDAEEGVYHVNVDAAAGRRSCECRGFCRWARCKHADGLAALVAAGKL